MQAWAQAMIVIPEGYRGADGVFGVAVEARMFGWRFLAFAFTLPIMASLASVGMLQ